MSKASNLIHVFDTYYLFQNKEKELVKVFTRDDTSATDIQSRYDIDSSYIFKGIFENKTNKFLSKEPGYIAKEPKEEINVPTTTTSVIQGLIQTTLPPPEPEVIVEYSENTSIY